MTSSGPTPEYRAFVEAGLGILMAVINADGKYSQEEFAWFKNAQHRHPLFRDVPPDAFNPMLHSVKAQLAANPWKIQMANWAKAVPEAYRQSIYELAIGLAVVDKELEGREPEVVTHLWRCLGLDETLARQLFMSRIEQM